MLESARTHCFSGMTLNFDRGTRPPYNLGTVCTAGPAPGKRDWGGGGRNKFGGGGAEINLGGGAEINFGGARKVYLCEFERGTGAREIYSGVEKRSSVQKFPQILVVVSKFLRFSTKS